MVNNNPLMRPHFPQKGGIEEVTLVAAKIP